MKTFWKMITYTAAGIALGNQLACSSEPTIGVTQFSSTLFVLGEGPWWDADLQQLVMVDIEGESLVTLSADGTQMKQYPLPGKPGTVVPTDKGKYLVAMGNQIVLFSEKQGVTGIIQTLGYSIDTLRFNDGKVAPDGSLWVGTVDCKTYSRPIASLYRLRSGTMAEQIAGVTVSNGIIWSPDTKTMYYIDSPTRTVKAYDYDARTAAISNGRTIIRTPEEWGTPDGCCIDAHGNLWIAQWGGACVALWDTQTGQMLNKINVPAKNVSAVALGGPKLDQIFITTASIAMEPDDIAKYPLAGAVFTGKVPVAGIAGTKWKE